MKGWVDAIALGIDRSGFHRLLAARGPTILMYHGIGGPDGLAESDFEAQLDCLVGRREVVPLARLVEHLEDDAARSWAAITFDDAYTDFAELAVPALRRRGLHATVFVPAGLVGRSNEWDQPAMAARPILDAAELRALDPEVVEIGCHGFSHRRMRGLDAAVLAHETAGARESLEQLLSREVRHFAYPYGQRGDFDRSAERAVEAAGFRSACSTWYGRCSREFERYRLRRVGIERGDDADVFVRKLEGAYDWVAGKERVAHAIRSALGPGIREGES